MNPTPTLNPSEAEFEQILQKKEFKTAVMKEYVRAPSLQGASWGDYIILPDIIAVDSSGEGWCFEVKSEKDSHFSMDSLRMSRGYTGPVWFLEDYKKRSYLEFSKAFKCPAVIAIKGEYQWKVGFFTRVNIQGKIEYNRDIVADRWNDERGCPILFNAMDNIEKFFGTLNHSAVSYGWPRQVPL